MVSSKRRYGKRSKRSKSKRSKICSRALSDKIRINMHELKNGLFKNRKQAIAVSYNQVHKMYPRCPS